MSVLLETSLGDIVIDLFCDKAPLACLNFIKLCKIKYYNGALFFNIQKGHLTRVLHENKSSTSLNQILYGDQAKYFNDQINPDMKHDRLGCVSTANVGPNMNDSNFFFTLSKTNIESLNGKHTIFGIVAEGLEVLEKINEVYVDEQNRPYTNIRILHTPVLDDPFDDPKLLEIPQESPEINYNDTERLDVNDDFDLIEGHGRTEEEIIEATKKHEAKTKAVILEMLNDLPDAEIKPPDNILFVCKLNPVTEEDDLETIFSQFGPIKSCEVIRDWKTGASLQYAFIEFETQAACEEAFFKMENALIDERRIHVDFSQSVSKYWFKHKSGNPIAYNGRGGGGGEAPGKGGHRGPRLELKTQHRSDKHGYGIVIEEEDAPRVPQRSYNDKKSSKPQTEKRDDDRQKEAKSIRDSHKDFRNREDKYKVDKSRVEKEREEKNRRLDKRRSRTRSASKERHQRSRKDRERSKSRSPIKRKEKDDRYGKNSPARRSDRDKERYKEKERERSDPKPRDDPRRNRKEDANKKKRKSSSSESKSSSSSNSSFSSSSRSRSSSSS